MRTATLASAALLAAHPILAYSPNPVAARADSSEDAYIQKVCNPPAPRDGFASGQVPPCISIDSIAKACQPDGTSPQALEAHAQCMCGGSYFSDYLGCQQCLAFHGARSERDNAHWASVLAVASSALCAGAGGGTPTASFPKLFESAGAAVFGPTTGATASSDAKSGATAVSLYFTAKGSQGPGPVTGGAAGATGTASATATPEETGSRTTGGASETTSGGDSGSETEAANTEAGGSTAAASSSTPTGNVAAPTGVAGAKGLLMAMAGGALVAAL